ncbi:MAG TPA: hemerythrin domain-containing protein [Polyangiaceae bacterium]|jgi:hypothetical protein
MTVGSIERFMVEDHARLDQLMSRALAPDEIDLGTFEAFREGLLRHIGMEEKVLLPFLRARGAPWPFASELRRDHGALAKMLVPTPTRERCDAICELLARHNPLEEGEHGLYAACDAVAGADAARLVEELRAAPRVPLAKHYDGPLIR